MVTLKHPPLCPLLKHPPLCPLLKHPPLGPLLRLRRPTKSESTSSAISDFGRNVTIQPPTRLLVSLEPLERSYGGQPRRVGQY